MYSHIRIALSVGKLQVVRYLIVDVGANPVARDNDGLTTLHAATQGGHLDVVRVSCNFYVYIRTCICTMYAQIWKEIHAQSNCRMCSMFHQ